MPDKKGKELGLKEVGTKIIFYGVKYSDHKKSIHDMAEAIKKEAKAHPIKNSPAKPVVYIIIPLSAYDYG